MLFKKYPKFTLPDGTSIFCLRRQEIPILYQQVLDYIKHGIEVKKNDTIFDVGANIGLFTLLVNRLCKEEANIYAFEPIPAIYDVLKENTQGLDREKVKILPYGISNISQTVVFAYYPKISTLSSLYPYDSPQEKEDFKHAIAKNLNKLPLEFQWLRLLPKKLCLFFLTHLINNALSYIKVTSKVKTLSDAIAEHKIEKIDLLKIDVEKSELDVFFGIKTSDWEKIKQIVVEVHNINNRVEKVVTLLKEHKFTQIAVERENTTGELEIYTVYAK